MPNSALLVPGTGGVTLLDNSGNDVGWPVLMRLRNVIRGVWGKTDEELIELLGMEHRPDQLAPAKSSLRAGVSLLPGHILSVAYNQFGSGVNQFRYDWRADMRHSAGQLLDFIRDRQPSNGRWNLVGHSQGALLIVLVSKLLDAEDDFSQHVATVTLVGAPLAGTLDAAYGMLVGDNAGVRLAPVIRATTRMWPAIYQMLPAWKSVLGDDDTPVEDSRQLTQIGGWPQVDGIQDDLLQRVRETQPLLRDPFAHMEGVDARIYMADNRKTTSEIRAPASGPLTWSGVEPITGDTLVPYATTMRELGSSVWPRVTRFGTGSEPHAYLFNDPSVASHIYQRFA